MGKKCKHCGEHLEKGTKICPVCGKKVKKSLFERVGFWIVLGIVLLFCACGSLIESEETPNVSTSLSDAELRGVCKSYTYEEIARNPEKYDGEYAKFTGEIVQIMEDAGSSYTEYTLRVNVTKGEYGFYSDTVYVLYSAEKGESRLLEGDIITMYGCLDGTTTYTSIFGQSITIPKFKAMLVEIK